MDRDQPPGASCRGAVRFRGLESLCRWRRGGREHEAPRRERSAIATRKSGIMRIDETGHDMSTGDANLKDTPGVSIFEHPKRPRTRRTGAFAQASRVNGAQEGAEAHSEVHTARPARRGQRTRPETAMRCGGHVERSFRTPDQCNERRNHLLPRLHRVPQGHQPPTRWMDPNGIVGIVPAGRLRCTCAAICYAH